MFSLQRFLSRDDKFFDLMEGSAEEAHTAIKGLVAMMRAPEEKRTLDFFVSARRKEKRLSQELTEQLCRTFVTPLEREDIEALAHALYKIPKTAEKFGERYLRAGRKAQGIDMSVQVEMLEKAAEVLKLMVKELRRGVELQLVKQQNDELQVIEGKGDKLMLDALQELYDGKHDPLQVMLLKDLLELLERLIDRCRDVGNIVFHIILKHS